MIGPGDELFESAGQQYWFKLAPTGTQGFLSDSPFAPKTTTGERSYADYDPFSAVAFSELTGGMGQERATDTTRYYNAVNVDARGGRIVLGPAFHPNTSSPHGLDSEADTWLSGSENHLTQAVTSGSKVAARFVWPTDATYLDRIWVAVGGNALVGTLTFSLLNDSSGEPGTAIATGQWKRDHLNSSGGWLATTFSPTQELVGGQAYWISIEHTGGSSDLLWYGADGTNNCRVWNGSSWQVPSKAILLFVQADDATKRPDGPLRYIVGAGEDGVRRVWGYHGRRLYFMTTNGEPTVVQSGSGTPYQTAADITDAVWFRSGGEAHPYLYLALGDGNDMVKFDGNIGAEQWSVVTGKQASVLATHDNLLWVAYSTNRVMGTDGTNWGQYVEIGDKTYAIRSMLSWNGYLYVGKDDGLYRVTYPTGYPVSGTPSATRILDFTPLAAATNFNFMVEHQGDLIFPIGNGILRFTNGGVLTSIAPDIGLNTPASTRPIFRAAASTPSVLWLLAEGQIGGPSVLFAVSEWRWHPIFQLKRRGDLARGLVTEPGIYGEARLWISAGLQCGYLVMPSGTNKRWLTDEADWATEGTVDLSWVDGNIRTVVKDWLAVEVDALNCADSGPYIEILWRQDDQSEFVSLGTIKQDGISRLSFSPSTYGAKMQIRARLVRGLLNGKQTTPQLLAVVIKYMERPEDSQAFTRVYLLSEDEPRIGVTGRHTMPQWAEILSTLRQAAEPLRFYPFWGLKYGYSKLVHWINYSVTEQRDERDGRVDMIIVVKMQVVE